jgi:hypothetical protein
MHVPAADDGLPEGAMAGSRRAVHMAGCIVLLLLLFGLLVFSVRYKSPTADEQNHLARGLAYLKTGDLRLSQEHPPGANAWAAWPLLLDPRITLPLDSPSWANAEWYGFADQLLWRRGAPPHPQAMIFGTRVPVMWLTCLLAALAYRWARELGGPWAGGIALALLVFDPNLLAHGRLTTNDMALTCTVLAASYALWRALRGRTERTAQALVATALAGAALGAALLAKYSALVMVPIAVLIWIAAGRKTARRARALHLALYLAIAALVTWAGYAFSWGAVPLLGGLPVPAPAFWSGIQSILRRTGGGSPAFLLGQHSESGWWVYFPVAFLAKTPLPTLVLLAAGLGRALCRAGFYDRRPADATQRRAWKLTLRRRTGTAPGVNVSPVLLSVLCLALPPLAFWAMAVAGSFNIGYRHILPSLPFFYVAAAWSLGTAGRRIRQVGRSPFGQAVCPWAVSGRAAPVLLGVLLVWLAAGTLRLAPHYLACFNALAGGPDNGYRILVDSNLDWGQDLPGLAAYVRETGEEWVYLSWFGAAHPEAYDLPFHPLPGFWRFGGEAAAYGYNPVAPAPGLYAISATNLQGVKLHDRDLYAWFRDQTPVTSIGYSILLYRVEPNPSATERLVLGVPGAQLAAQDRDLLGRAYSVRQSDPASGWIEPAGAGELWILSPQPPEGAEWVRDGPSYVVARLGEIAPSPLALAPPDGARFDHVRPLELQLGLDADGKDTLTVVVRWQVGAPPHRATVSFAHLLDAQGAYRAGWDGLTAPATCWQAGDRIEQRYAIPLPSELPPGAYPIEIGWYDADTGQRWAYRLGDEIAGDRWLVEWNKK